ncbi:ribonuclease H-like domain-containing protein [Ochromonadaceae sp. CCMP2298]|nr:ribonuclease H-like domain-containing protein [Ochromonadaceae sp. CCMP2298]
MVPRPLLSGRAGLVVIFDIETTGLPKGDNFDNARIVQMCCVLCCRSTLEERERVSVIIKTDGFPVLLSKLHGITEEISLRDGELFEAAATRVGALFSQASAVIAHNVQFDTSVFQSELSRYGMLDLLTTVQDMQAICSMKTTTKLCDLKNKVGKPKPPKLNELYLHATGKQMQNHHNAIYDVLNLREALQALLVKGDVDLE